MKGGIIIFIFLICSISLISAANHTASSIIVNVDSISRNIEAGTNYFLGTHTYSSISSLTGGQHDANEIWVYVQDGQMTLLQALQSIHKLCPKSSSSVPTAPADKSKAYHLATEITLSSGKTLQQVINDGSLCGCVPSTTKKCGTDDACANYTTVTCLSTGIWPACGTTYIAPRGTACGSDTWHACSGAGECQGWSGTGCTGFSAGVINGASIKCWKLSDTGGNYAGTNSLGTFYINNYYVQCSYNCNCKVSGGCDTCTKTWYIKPATANTSVINSCTAPSTSSGDGGPPAGSTYTGGGGCFLADTPILMADGSSKEIKDIVRGDIVISYNTETKEFVSSVVNKLIIHDGKNYPLNDFSKFPLINLEVLAGNKLINLEVTVNHPFYNPINGEFKEIGEFKVGDKLKTIFGEGTIIERKEVINENSSSVKKLTIVYNLEMVGEPRNYVTNSFVVHNILTAQK